MMGGITAEVVHNATFTRACLITPEGEYVCSVMKLHRDNVTLHPLGKTRDSVDAQIWLDTGFFTGTRYD